MKIIEVDVLAEVACYHCYGNSFEQGQFCSIDHLCLGQSCVFSVQSSGEWASGCTSEVTSTIFDCTTRDSGSELNCKCMSDLCNNFKVANETVGRFLGTCTDRMPSVFSKDTTLILPRLLVKCIECGNVSIGGHAFSIPCTEEQICQGDFCVTKRGLNPYSYCDTTWTGTNEVGDLLYETSRREHTHLRHSKIFFCIPKDFLAIGHIFVNAELSPNSSCEFAVFCNFCTSGFPIPNPSRANIV
ncbi:unnamed protein product [Angiostrongylus costaricensis]|uniref:UPAR/Ly6 domain-containing protein n=1 Tax=Angiostrongylus costaricensis TaxID=334426 RepID=A0A0R3PJ03_ANGCS|nr:unnamed protein product [Angiostrongylus costaricensis]